MRESQDWLIRIIDLTHLVEHKEIASRLLQASDLRQTAGVADTIESILTGRGDEERNKADGSMLIKKVYDRWLYHMLTALVLQAVEKLRRGPSSISSEWDPSATFCEAD